MAIARMGLSNRVANHLTLPSEVLENVHSKGWETRRANLAEERERLASAPLGMFTCPSLQLLNPSLIHPSWPIISYSPG